MADVSWDADTKGITLCDGSNLYFTWIDKDHAFKTSATALEDTTVMDVPPTIMNDYTMVPLRAISKCSAQRLIGTAVHQPLQSTTRRKCRRRTCKEI